MGPDKKISSSEQQNSLGTVLGSITGFLVFFIGVRLFGLIFIFDAAIVYAYYLLVNEKQLAKLFPSQLKKSTDLDARKPRSFVWWFTRIGLGAALLFWFSNFIWVNFFAEYMGLTYLLMTIFWQSINIITFGSSIIYLIKYSYWPLPVAAIIVSLFLMITYVIGVVIGFYSTLP